MSESLKRQTLKGVAWSAAERFSVQGVQFLLSIVIARLVAPSEYGLIAMLGIFLSIAQAFVDSGFSNALIQKKNRTEADFSTVFYFNIVVACAVYLLLFFAAPLIADFYREPLLKDVARLVGLNLIVSAFAVVQLAKLTIKLDFKTQAKASLAAVIISGILGITLAYRGYGVWALAAQALGGSLLNTILLWVFAKWRPRRVFDRKSFKGLFAFGSKLLIGGLMHTVYMNLYTMIIGFRFAPADVGYFSRSQSLASFPSINLTGIVSRAVYPMLCKVQDEEEKLKKTLLQYLSATAFMVFPLMTVLAVLSAPLIQVILTEKWLPAAPLLSILCLAYGLHPIAIVNWQLLNAKGRSDLSLRAEIIRKITVFLILFAVMPFGVKAMCWGLAAGNAADIVILVFYVKKLLPVGYRTEIRILSPIVLSCLLTGIGVYLITQMVFSPALQLLFGLATGCALYLGSGFLLKLPEISFLITNKHRI